MAAFLAFGWLKSNPKPIGYGDRSCPHPKSLSLEERDFELDLDE
jgi:hypothetical protein